MNIKRNKFLFRNIWKNYNIVLILIVLLIICGISSENFFTQRNIFSLLRQQSFLLIISLGMLFTIICGGIDLSVGAVVALAAVITSILYGEEYSMSLPMVVICVLGIGTVIGFTSGLLIDIGKMNPFVATLAMMTICRGLAYAFSNASPIFLNLKNLNPIFSFIGQGYFYIIPAPVVISFGLTFIVYIILRKTIFGRMIFAIGGNKEAVKFSGIKITKYIIGAYAISGLLSSLAGIILCSRLSMSHPGLGEGYELDAIAAVILGGASFTGGQGSAFNTLVGVLILGLIRNILNLLNVASYPQMIIKGIIIIIAVLASEFKK